MKSRQDFDPNENGYRQYKSYLKTHFAGLAMQGLMSNSAAIGALINTQESIPFIMESLAKKSIELSDELLKQLEDGE